MNQSGWNVTLSIILLIALIGVAALAIWQSTQPSLSRLMRISAIVITVSAILGIVLAVTNIAVSVQPADDPSETAAAIVKT